MFTGLIEETGAVIRAEDFENGRHLVIEGNVVMSDLAVDHSIAVNGVCLTVTSRDHSTFSVDVIAETLKKTTTGDLEVGSRVNLERAMKLGDRLGGHIVQGHVDATGTVDVIEASPLNWNMWIRFPRGYRKWIIPVGSICINGVSLTVAQLEDERLMVSIIPHTLSVTTIGSLQAGDRINLEFDVLAKYAENARLYQSSNPAGM